MVQYDIDDHHRAEVMDFSTVDKVPAIKHARMHTLPQMSLRDAKIWVESGCVLGREITIDHSLPFKVVCINNVAYLMKRLFELTEEISEIHRKLQG